MLFSVPLLVFATHGHWIDHYANDKGMSCCGTNDCLVVPMRLIHITEETVTLDIAGHPVTIPRQSFHNSEDTQDYWCTTAPHEKPGTQNTRCAFVAHGS
jgi:hypothetical protein